MRRTPDEGLAREAPRYRWWPGSGSSPSTTATSRGGPGRCASAWTDRRHPDRQSGTSAVPDVPKLLNHLYVNQWSKLPVGGVIRRDVRRRRHRVRRRCHRPARQDHYLMSRPRRPGAAGVWEWVRTGCRPPTRVADCTARRSPRPRA
ncbi:hypothetical protein HBB16_09020 [Pseudonocardia sp. MCCB 268]|nr:hypothetical protein [Pseudonocardia cytotoxica]